MNVLSATTQQHIEETLINDGLVTEAELVKLKNDAQKAHQPLLTMLLGQGRISDEQLTKALAKANDLPYVNLTNAYITPKVLELLPRDLAESYMAVPLGEMQNRLVVAMLDADNVQAIDFLSSKIGRPLKIYAASESGIHHIIQQYKGSVDQRASEAFQTEEDIENLVVDEDKRQGKVEALSQDSPVSKILTSILQFAVNNGASDVHIEPLEHELKVRCRIDGILREIMKLPKSAEPAIVTRIKILATLKIDEHRVPQDGQFSIHLGGSDVDLRIAVSPVVWGEQIVIRLLDKGSTSLKLEDMGYRGRALRLIRAGLARPHGMILTSGPTGSGKTTSMYAMIQEIKNDTINIVTLEDPVEYKIEDVNQIQVNPDVGLTFATGLRSILRQDPDVIMVGEIRDKETANLAVQAALTGHLVFATLHTNSAAGILPRLLDMDIEPFLIASTVHTVIGQRLVRRVVPGGETYQSSKVETQAIQSTIGHLLPKTKEEQAIKGQDLGYDNLPLAAQNAYTLIKGKETPSNPTGYAGRMGLYEVFEVSEEIEDLILKHSTSSIIQKKAIEQGMITMRQDGYLKALAGLTTLTEVNRVAAAGND